MKYINWTAWEPDVIALTTTKAIGNMAFQVGNNIEEVKHAREQVIEDLQIPSDHLVFVHQSHSDRIEKVDESYFGKGMNDFESGPDCDALYTDKTNIALGVFHADCVPVFIYSKEAHIVGIIHAGFKGTLKEITKKSLLHIINKEKINPKTIQAYIGPFLSREFYDISQDDEINIRALGYQDAIIKEINKTNVRLELINKMQLESVGVPSQNIHISIYDTGKDEFLYSAYKNHPVGRMASIIMLRK